jgi:hypothetical protein
MGHALGHDGVGGECAERDARGEGEPDDGGFEWGQVQQHAPMGTAALAARKHLGAVRAGRRCRRGLPPVVHRWGMRDVVIGAALAVVFGAAAAQDPAWRVPPAGAVEYERSGTAGVGDLVRTPSAARALPVGAKAADGKGPDRFLHRLAPAPWLCAGELRRDARAVATPIRDLRDVLRAAACDAQGRSLRVAASRVLPFGDVTVTGSWTTPDAEGRQALRASLTARAVAGEAGEARETTEALRRLCLCDADGSVAIERRWDAARGIVAEWKAIADLVVAEEPRQYRRLVVEESWRFVAVRANQDVDFRMRVTKAIEAGVSWVRAAIDEKKTFLDDRRSADGDRNYGSGRLALALLTLVHGHVPGDDPIVQRGFAELVRRRIEDSYSLAVALMAVSARHGAQMPLPEKKAAERWLAQLLQNVDPRGEALSVLRFNYTAGPRYDTSLQQYGLLGLRAAQRSGLDVPADAFARAARHLLAVQQERGPSATVALTTHEHVRLALGGDRPPAADEKRARRRGFAYQDAHEPPFGSMTSAGISGLLLARDGMEHAAVRDRALRAAIDDAIVDGFAWLAGEFSVRDNPGHAERADHHWYYWLYGLERCCELAGVARLDGRDWYYEGALQLLSQQQENGSFRAEHPSTLLLDSTCFAVLFLAKASAMGPLTGGR